MAEPKIFFVHLRRPKNAGDRRDDPFYEVGSFGCTGCHSHNLLHPKNAGKLVGARLAFVQGGKLGSRLVLLTPPVTVAKKWMKHEKGKWVRICEVKWKPADMPLRYADAPVLVSNDGSSDFPSVRELACGTRCPSLVSGLSSLLRSRAGQMDDAMAKEVVRIYTKRRRKAVARSGIAAKYQETMSPGPQNPDARRKATYRKRIKELVAGIGGTDGVMQAVPLPGAASRSCCSKPSPSPSGCEAKRCT